MKNKILIVLISFLGLFGCSKKSTPESALEEFVEYRLDGGKSLDKIVSLTTGSLKERLEAMEEEEKNEFFSVEDLKRGRLKILLKNCEGAKCFLTYTLKYSKGSSDPKEFGVEVKKIAQLELVDEDWKLSDVSNLKTYIKGNKNLDVSSEGETKAP